MNKTINKNERIQMEQTAYERLFGTDDVLHAAQEEFTARTAQIDTDTLRAMYQAENAAGRRIMSERDRWLCDIELQYREIKTEADKENKTPAQFYLEGQTDACMQTVFDITEETDILRNL